MSLGTPLPATTSRPFWFGAIAISIVLLAVYAPTLSDPAICDVPPSSFRELLPSLDARPGASRLINVFCHIAAALALFAVTRDILLRGRVPTTLRSSATPFALAAAGVWSLHPLHTQALHAVPPATGVIAGSLTLIAFLLLARSARNESSSSRRWLWLSGAAAAMAIALHPPLAVLALLLLLFDRAFVSGSFGAALSQRRFYYAGLGVLGLWFLFLARHTWNVPHADVKTWFLAQSHAAALYLKLSLWPSPLIFDYGPRLSTDLSVFWPAALLLVVLGSLTLVAVFARPIPGFLGASFFLLLAGSAFLEATPTTPVLEARTYLASVAVVMMGVILLQVFARRLRFGICLGLALAFATGASFRNQVYRSAQSLWSDTAEKRPDNPRAHLQLARTLLVENDPVSALQSFAAALRLQPTNSAAHAGLARTLLAQPEVGRLQVAQALRHAEAAVRLAPSDYEANFQLGRALMADERAIAAIPYFQAAVCADPSQPDAHLYLAQSLHAAGRIEEARMCIAAALKLQPGNTEAQQLQAELEAGEPARLR